MNPARDKRRRLFEAFNNKQNINAANIDSYYHNYSISLEKPSSVSSFNSCSSIYRDQLFKLQSEVRQMRQERSTFQHKADYNQKMECFYLSELATLRQRQDRTKRKMQILIEQMPSSKPRSYSGQDCAHCQQLFQQNQVLRQQVSLKDKLIKALESDLSYQSLQTQIIKRHEQSLWRNDTEQDCPKYQCQ